MLDNNVLVWDFSPDGRLGFIVKFLGENIPAASCSLCKLIINIVVSSYTQSEYSTNYIRHTVTSRKLLIVQLN